MSVTWVVGGQYSGNAIIAYSTDGIAYTQSANASTIFSQMVRGIAHNGLLWVAGGYGVGYSYDAITWNASSSGNSILQYVNSITYGNGKFLAMGFGTTYVAMYSTDGINWTGTMPKSTWGGWGMGAIYRNSLFVICGGAGFGNTNNMIAYSTDAINWTFSNTTILSAETRMVEYNGIDKWVAVGTNANPSTIQVAYTSNIISGTWSGSLNTYSNRANYVKWGNGKFIVNGYLEQLIYTSTNGVNWSSVSSPNFGTLGGAINWNNNLWLMGQQYSTKALLYSNDNGSTWNVCTLSNCDVIYGIAYAIPPPYSVGSAPTITSITNNTPTSISVFFTPGTGGTPAPTTYFYSLNGGAYTNANSTTSPILITGLSSGINYNVTLIANNLGGNTVASNVVVGFIPYPCFLQGTKILRLNVETDEEEYVAVEKLRRGDLITTYNHGYKAIELIGSKVIPRPLDISKPSSRLYWFRKSRIPRLREDLCVTGDHCILHKMISTEKKHQVFAYMGDIFITEDHYRVPAFLDDRAESYENADAATIWHFALENPNIYHNYGVMANGILVESSSLHYMYKYSNMKMV